MDPFNSDFIVEFGAIAPFVSRFSYYSIILKLDNDREGISVLGHLNAKRGVFRRYLGVRRASRRKKSRNAKRCYFQLPGHLRILL